jgi:2-keto-4-pentenoate hydratase
MKITKKLLVGIILTLFILSSVVAFGSILELGLIKQDLLFGRAFNRPFQPISPRLKNFNTKMAYELQDWLVGKLVKMKNAKIIGYKVAFTSPLLIFGRSVSLTSVW